MTGMRLGHPDEAFPGALENLREHFLSPAGFAVLSARIELCPDAGSFVAEDGAGRTYDFAATGDLREARKPHVLAWLGVAPDRSRHG